MARHVSSVVIERPSADVWAFLVDPFSVPRMGGGRLRLRVTSPGPLGLGSSIQQRVAMLGFETSIDTVVTEWDPPRAVTHSISGSAKGGLMRSATFRTSLEETPAGTKVMRMADMEPRGILRFLWPMLWPVLVPRMDAQTSTLKRLLEAPRPRGG